MKGTKPASTQGYGVAHPLPGVPAQFSPILTKFLKILETVYADISIFVKTGVM